MGAIANLFGYLLNFLYNTFNNYGIAIIVFSVILRIILIPVTIFQQKSMKKSAELQEKMKEIQKKYKNNPDLVESLIKECIEYNKSLEFKPIEGGYDGEFKQGEPLDMSVFPNISVKETDDIWEEPIDDDVWDLY